MLETGGGCPGLRLLHGERGLVVTVACGTALIVSVFFWFCGNKKNIKRPKFLIVVSKYDISQKLHYNE
jgi:hypothetical protein